MFHLLLILAAMALAFVGLRAVRAQAGKPQRRVIGPDDDPEFLRKIG